MKNEKILNLLYYIICGCFIIVLFINLLTINSNKNLSSNDIFNNSIYSIVELKASTEDYGESFGTAEFIDNNGSLVTNAHVVTYKSMNETHIFDNISIRFAFEEDYRSVKLIKYNSELDIAILQLDDLNCKFKPLEIGDSSKVSNGDNIYAIGNLNNIGISITKGIVSNSNIDVIYNDITRNVIQCDLIIADGNSGGALLDSNGKLIGITTFRLKDQKQNVIYGIAYCVPINIVLEYK